MVNISQVQLNNGILHCIYGISSEAFDLRNETLVSSDLRQQMLCSYGTSSTACACCTMHVLSMGWGSVWMENSSMQECQELRRNVVNGAETSYKLRWNIFHITLAQFMASSWFFFGIFAVSCYPLGSDVIFIVDDGQWAIAITNSLSIYLFLCFPSFTRILHSITVEFEQLYDDRSHIVTLHGN